MRTFLIMFIAAFLAAATTVPAIASVNDDQVTSQKIKEADGTSGQNTNSGSGVKTGHIQNGAVTDAKITGPISASKIQSGVFQNKYANVVVVAKSGGDYTDPIQAINLITSASASNPYLVKIMPGVYNLGTASVQMKPYVDVEGSGPDNTIITSSNYNVDGDTCTVGTMVMANNSTIRHIKVVNMPPAQNGSFKAVSALVFNNVKAKAEGISVLVGSDTVDGGRTNGICVSGESAFAALNNISVETHNNGGQSNPIIMFTGGSLTLTNSQLAGFNSAGRMVHGINSGGWSGGNPGIVNVINSTIEGTSTVVNGIYLDGYKASISNSVITMNVGTGIVASALDIRGMSDFSIVNTKFTCDGTMTNYIEGTLKIANSLLPGDLSGLSSAKLVNNYDADFNPIPNQ